LKPLRQAHFLKWHKKLNITLTLTILFSKNTPFLEKTVFFSLTETIKLLWLMALKLNPISLLINLNNIMNPIFISGKKETLLSGITIELFIKEWEAMELKRDSSLEPRSDIKIKQAILSMLLSFENLAIEFLPIKRLVKRIIFYIQIFLFLKFLLSLFFFFRIYIYFMFLKFTFVFFFLKKKKLNINKK
jgi:hypothetical protein